MAIARIHKAEESAARMGANSQAIVNGDLVVLVGGGVTKAINTSTAPLVGVSNQTITTTATNMTTDKAEVSYTRIEPYDTRVEITTSAAIADADVGKYYALTAAGLVDTATGNAEKQDGSVVRLEEIVGSTRGIFVAVV